jgi:hypothetical protein
LRWGRLVEQQRESGLSVKAFCAARGLSPSSFFGWRAKLMRPPAAFAAVKVGREPTRSVGDDQAASSITLCLAEMARSVTAQEPMEGHLFLFRGRFGDRLKILYWDRDGFALWYKRLEDGSFKLPRIEAGAASVELRASELAGLSHAAADEPAGNCDQPPGRLAAGCVEAAYGQPAANPSQNSPLALCNEQSLQTNSKVEPKTHVPPALTKSFAGHTLSAIPQYN